MSFSDIIYGARKVLLFFVIALASFVVVWLIQWIKDKFGGSGE